MLIETPLYLTPQCVALGSKYFPIFWLATDPPILVEGGVSAVIPPALKQMKELNLIYPNTLVLLHEHNDHVLGVPPLMEKLPTLEAVGTHETAQLLSKEKVIEGYRQADQFFTRVLKEHGEGEETNWKDFPSVSTLEECPLPTGIHTLSTPGHSPGSCALFWEKEGILFVSDSMGYYSSQGKHFPLFFQNLELYLESIEKVAELSPSILVLGHLQCFKGEEVTMAFHRSREEALKLADRVKKAGEKAEEMVFHAIHQDELITFYLRDVIRECARLLVKRALDL